jgi:hypothetical protein
MQLSDSPTNLISHMPLLSKQTSETENVVFGFISNTERTSQNMMTKHTVTDAVTRIIIDIKKLPLCHLPQIIQSALFTVSPLSDGYGFASTSRYLGNHLYLHLTSSYQLQH